MSDALKLLIRVVRRRVEAGYALEDILKAYPKLKEDEKAAVRAAVEGSK